MNDGLKRNIQYLSRYQLRFMAYYVGVGILYGIVMAFILSESYEKGWENGLTFFRLFLVIAVTTTQIGVVKNQFPFVLSLSSRRKDLNRGHLIMTVEMILEASLFLVIGNLFAWSDPTVTDLGVQFVKYVVLLFIASSMGVLVGLLPTGMGAGVARIAMVVVFVIAIVIVTAISAVISNEIEVMKMFINLIGDNTDRFFIVFGALCVIVTCGLTILAHGMVAKKVKKMEVQL